MRNKLLMVLSVLFVMGCEETKTFIPDNSAELETQAELAEAQAEIIAARFFALEARVTDLEGRLDLVEGRIDSLTDELMLVADRVTTVEQDIVDIREELREHCRKLRLLARSDRQMRREYTRQINLLYWKLCNEIRNRQQADADLQDQLDGLQEQLDNAEAHQAIINQWIAFGMSYLQGQISWLNWEIERLTWRFYEFKEDVRDALADIRGDIRDLNYAMYRLNRELEDVKDDLVSIVYPCGYGANKEVLLKTQDGLVGVFLYGSNKSVSFQDQETIPAHAVCTQVVNPPGQGGPVCIKVAPVAEQTATTTTTINYYSVDDVRLGRLGNGTYSSSSGWSCTFTVNNGQVQ